MSIFIKGFLRLLSLYYAVVTLLTLIIVTDLFIRPRTQALGSTGMFEILALGWLGPKLNCWTVRDGSALEIEN